MHFASLLMAWLLWVPVANVQTASSSGDIEVVQLKCEYTDNPLGVDSIQPQLFWQIRSSVRAQRQSAYRILVATSPQVLAQDQGDLWDTGEQISDKTTLIPYQGVALKSSQVVFWKVRAWDSEDQPSPWSRTANWTMGILKDEDWRAKWIVAPWTSEALLLRKEFVVRPDLRRAIAHFCGLGHYELSLNGNKSTDNLLSPGWSKYNRTCLYETQDITELLQEGPNAVGLALGNGMYHTERRNRFSKFQGTFGPLRAYGQIELEYGDGTHEIIPTDESWRVSRGPVTYNDVYGGEDFDARLVEKNWNRAGFDEAKWTPAVELVRPSGKLRGFSASAPPIRAIEVIEPISINTLTETTDVVDFGQNASYMPRISVFGPAGSTVRLTHAEVLHKDGTIDRGTCGGNRGPAYWQYTKATDELETWFPQFFYAGCRYLQVDKIPTQEGGELPQLVHCSGVVVHSTAQPIGEFSCSNELLNRIRTLVRWAQRSNMVSVLTDCPHREKLGWLEQYHLNGPAIRYEFEVLRIFAKGMRDMADSQLANGLVPNIAPEYVEFPGTFRAAAEWGSAVILVPWQQYQFTGDSSLFEVYYKTMQRYMEYLGSKASDHIVSEGLGDWYDLGPAERPGFAQLTQPPITATAFYYLDARLMSKIAKLLGNDKDSANYEKLATEIRKAWRREFRNQDGTYGTSSQCINAIGLEIELVESDDRAQVLEALVEDVRANNNATTAGDVGHRYVLQALAHNGHSDLIYDMINQDERPGYGYQLKQGATSLTEAWDANHNASHNHFMLGHITEWFYGHLVGIQFDPKNSGFKNIIIAPSPVSDLTWAQATYESLQGPIRVRWEQGKNGFALDVSIPANSTATVHLPVIAESSILENGKPAEESVGVQSIRREKTKAIIEIESGDYQFLSP